MHARHLAPMVDDLHTLGRPGQDILTAWNANEDLLDLLALARTHPSRENIASLLHRSFHRCAHCGLPELERLATTVETWWPEIEAFLHTGITNAGSEGTNRVIKTIARDGLRLPQPGEPAPTHPLRHHPPQRRTPQAESVRVRRLTDREG
ncbi:transposase [Dactylosporangium sp. NPDC051484]|uniref:transposase n=1 Tax=Dactylosporangium sp. NPDC051484 TaxID=3154942 RepID=UPI00344CCA15